MRRGIKYRLEAYSKKYRDVYRVDILQENYFGDVYYKNIGAGGLRFEKWGGVLQPTFLTITIQSDENFEFLQFFQYENRRHPVNFYKNDVKIWSGYIIAESYQEPYVAPPYDVQVVATDGLGMLDKYEFQSSDLEGELATNPFLSKFDIINGCLDKLGISIEYEIGIDLLEENMDSGESVLHQTYLNRYIFDGEKCNEILKKVLPNGAIITQKNNRWVIRRPYEDAEKTHLVYDTDGNYLGTTQGEPVLQMGAYSEGGIWPHVSPLLTMEHAVSDVKIEKDYGVRKSFLKNWNFTKGKNYWGFYGNEEWGFEVRFDGNGFYGWLPGYAPTDEEFIHQGIEVESSFNTGGFVFKFKYCHVGGETFRDTVTGPVTVKLKAFIVLESTAPIGFVYYLGQEGWTTTPTKIEVDVSTKLTLEYSTFEIVTDNIPADGNLNVYLYKVPRPDSTRFIIKGSAYTDVEAYTLNRDEYTNEDPIEFIIRKNAPDTKDITLKPVDVPDVKNVSRMFDNGQFYYDETKLEYKITQLWRNSSGDLLPFTDIIKNQLIEYYGNPRQIISGCEWRGTGLHLNAVARHLYNYGRKFYADFGSWEILQDVWNITWLEIPGTDTELPGWITEEGIWDDNENWKDDDRWEDENINLVEVDINGLTLHDITYVFEVGDIIDSIDGLGHFFINTDTVTLPYTILEGDLVGFRGPNQRTASTTYINVVRPFADAAGDELIRVKLNCIP